MIGFPMHRFLLFCICHMWMDELMNNSQESIKSSYNRREPAWKLCRLTPCKIIKNGVMDPRITNGYSHNFWITKERLRTKD